MTFSTPTLLRLAQGHEIDADRFVTHHFTLDQFEEAYGTFARAGETGALKVVLTRPSGLRVGRRGRQAAPGRPRLLMR